MSGSAAAGFATADASVEDVSAEVQLLLTPEVPGIINIHDAHGEVSTKVMIHLRQSTGRVLGWAQYRPEDDGRLLIPSLSPGTWRLNIRVFNGSANATVEIDVPGEPTRVVLLE